MRYCIVSSPRTGTTALAEALRIYSFQNNPISVYFGELHHFGLSLIHVSTETMRKSVNDYNSEENKKIRDVVNYYIEKTDFPMVGKYFPHFWQFEYFNPIEYPKFLLDNNFELIHVRRNLFDSIISSIVANYTNYWHNSIDPSYTEKNKPNLTKKISLNFEFCLKIANHMNLSYYLVTQICKKYPITVINYENLIEESATLFPCEWNQITLEKTYNKPYNEIIENYVEVESWLKDFIHE